MHLIFDGNNFAFRTFHSGYQRVINVDGREISVIQSVLRMLRNTISDIDDIDDIIFCWDSDGSEEKQKILPEYKGTREQSEIKQILEQQTGVLKSILNIFGIKQLYYNGIEADDIIYVITKILNHVGQECSVVSADKDLLQIINPLCKIMNLNKKRMITVANFEEMVGVPIDGFVDYLSLIGDKSDNIDGVKGIGPETAKRIIKLYGNCDNFYEKENEIRTMISVGKLDNAFSQRMIIAFEECNKEKLYRNRELITLGKLLDIEKKRMIIADYEKQKNVKLKIEAIKDFFREYHLYEMNQNIGVFLVPFMRVKNNNSFV